jgi:competence protein ComEC
MKVFWAKYQAIRLLIPFITGIVINIVLPGYTCLPVVLLFISTTGILFCLWYKEVAGLLKLRLSAGMLVCVLLGSTAYLLTHFHTQSFYRSHFSNYLQNEDSKVIGYIAEPTAEKSKHTRFILNVTQIYNRGIWRNVSGRLIVSVEKNTASRKLLYGDQLMFSGYITNPKPPMNPEEFNYKQYLAFKNIYQQITVKEGEWAASGINNGNTILRKIYSLRSVFLTQLTQHVRDPNSFGVASAIMLGYRDYVTAEVNQAYTSSGALHVLSVSGLHVGIVYVVLNFLLFFMEKTKHLRIVKVVFIIIFIWFYACITGLCPSVLRSAAMFSIIAIGRLYGRSRNMLNIIAASALILLIYDPYLIADVGFKLSYLAVTGIVYLHEKIYKSILIKNKWIDIVWSLTAVSIAAQLTTFPLSLLYFHQFPTYFLFSNLVVIPLGNIVLYLGMALFSIAPFKVFADVVGWCFDWLIWVLNQFIFFVDRLPYSIFKGITITGIECILIYIIILLAASLLREKRPKVLIAALAFSLILAISFSITYIKHEHQQKLIVYNAGRAKAMAFVKGRNAFMDFDEKWQANESNMLYHIRPHFWQMGIDKELRFDTYIDKVEMPFGKAFQVNNTKVILMDGKLNNKPYSGEKLIADLVVFSGKGFFDTALFARTISTPAVVIDASVSSRNREAIKQYFESQSVRVWDVAAQGAFVLDV